MKQPITMTSEREEFLRRQIDNISSLDLFDLFGEIDALRKENIAFKKESEMVRALLQAEITNECEECHPITGEDHCSGL